MEIPFQQLNQYPKELLSQQIEILKTVAAGREDPVLFTKEVLGIELYDEQKIWLWSTTKTQKEQCYRLMQKLGIFFITPEGLITDIDILYHDVSKHVLCVANQIGKTFLAAIKHIWSNYYKMGLRVDTEHIDMAEYKTLNISPHSDQSHKCYEYVERICRGELVFYDPTTNSSKVNKIHDCIAGFLVGHNENLGEIKFANGSIFYSKSAAQDKATARAGEQFGIITFDECAQSLHLSEEITMLLSRIMRYGYCLDLISSPEVEKPSHQHYNRLVKKGRKLQDGWFALTDIVFDKNVFIHPEQREKAKEQIRSTDLQKYKQMVEGKFISTGKRFFSLEVVSQMFDAMPGLVKLEMGIPGRKYIIGVDWGMSDTGDKTIFKVIDWTDHQENLYKIVHHDIMEGGSPTMKLAALRILFDAFGGHGKNDEEGNPIWNKVHLIMDTNSMGGVMIKKMLADLKPIDFTSHGGQKDDMLAHLHEVLNFKRKYKQDQMTGDIIEEEPNFGKIRSYFIPELEEQLGNYQIKDEKLETDLVMALGMAIWYLEVKIPRKPVTRLNLNPLSRYNEIKGIH